MTTEPSGAPSATSVVVAFNEAFGAQDLDRLALLLDDECVFEDTTPPDGVRHEGRRAVLDAFAAFFSATASPRFTVEGMRACGDDVVVRWRFEWAGEDGGAGGHVRGVDHFTVSDDRIAAKLVYVKG